VVSTSAIIPREFFDQFGIGPPHVVDAMLAALTCLSGSTYNRFNVGNIVFTLATPAPPSTDKPGSGRQDILRVLKECYPETMSVSDLEEALPEMNASTLKMTLKRMVEDGQIEKSQGGSTLHCLHRSIPSQCNS